MIKLRMKIGLCTLLVGLLLFAPLAINVSAEENANVQAAQDVVNIPDPAFKSYLNGLLGQPSSNDITEAQMDTITDISITGGNVADITGIDYAHNLRTLRLSNTLVTDFSLIANLSNVENIYLAGSNVTSDSIPDLSNLQKLARLNISPANLDNDALTKINNLPNLTTLNLDQNYSITDISSLKSLPNLNSLHVQFCGINDFRGIDTFPKLKNLYAYGQNVGRTVLINSSIKSSALNYNEANQTLFVPFTLMTERSINFNGDIIPFSTSTSSSSTYFTLNEVQIPGTRLSIDNTGVTVNGITKEYFDSITKMEYNATYNNPGGSYATPPNFDTYYISAGTYDHYFDIDHSLTITNDPTISYTEGTSVTEEQFLTDVHAETDDGTPVTSDFDSVVDFNSPGVYTVTLNAENGAGLQATPTTVAVTILAKPVITADESITYTVDTTKTAEQFLNDISAKTSDGSVITSDFDTVVDLTKVGTYEVTLHAVSADGVEADPIKVLVTVAEGNIPPTPPNPDPTPDPDPSPTPNPDSTPSGGDDTVYSSDSSDSPATYNVSSNGTSSTTKNDPSPKSKNALPTTGDTNQTFVILIGIIFIGTAVLFFRKRTHS